MLRPFSLALLGLVVFLDTSAAESLEGTWRQTTPNIGQSDWVLSDNGNGTYRAQEFGLGRAHGTAHFKNGVLTIDWRNGGDAGLWEWKLNGKSGTGALIFTHGGTGIPGGVQRPRGGKKVLVFEKCRVKLLPPPSRLVSVWKQSTPGIGESVWTLARTGADTFRATESGLGNVRGTARLKDDLLTIHWSNGGDAGLWEWKLNGKSGTGALMFTQGGSNLPGGISREHNGQKVLAFDHSTVRPLAAQVEPGAPPRFTLPVKLLGQQNESWCFAAATQMVLDYNGTKVSQGELLNVFTGRTDCCGSPTPGPCLGGGGETPLFEHYHYTVAFRHGPLTPQEVVREIYTRRKPFIFGWDWKGGGSHSLVAVGYARIKGGFLVEVLDPSPVPTGSRYFCTYQQWVEDAGHVYQDSIFNISPPGQHGPDAGPGQSRGRR